MTDPVPAFRAEDDQGRVWTEADLSEGLTVLYFYPKDDTPGCIKQACGFRDGLDAFRERGARVIGVSPDDRTSHEAFRDKYRLTFPLLADPDHSVAEAFGVWGTQRWGEHTYEGVARTTFLIADGVIHEVFRDVEVMGHPERVLASLPAPTPRREG